MMRRSTGYLEAVIIVILGVLFLRFFGWSTFAKWERQDVQIVKRKEEGRSLPPPAVTICPVLVGSESGWKPSPSDEPGLDKCEGQGDMEDCVRKNTFALGDVLKSSSRLTYLKDKNDLEDGEELINSSLWTSRMTDTANGMCHTLIYDKHISKRTYLQIGLNLNITAVFLHDPKFFVFKDTNVLVPFLKLKDVYNKEFIILATTRGGRCSFFLTMRCFNDAMF